MDTAPEREPLELRVELHPFLVGLHSHHIRLLADCAMARSFDAGEYLFRQGEFANRFYLIEEGMVVLEALNNAGTCVWSKRLERANWWAVVALPAIYLAFRRACDRADQALIFSCTDTANTAPRSVVRLSFQKNARDDRTFAVRPHTPSQQPSHPGKSEEPSEAAAVRK